MEITAPMSGSVIKLLVEVGQSVSPGQELLVIESMKMEIPLESPGSGTVAEILVTPPHPVSEGDVLLRLAS